MASGPRSELEPGVRVAALGADGGLVAGLRSIQPTAAETVKSQLLALGIEKSVIPPIIVNPDSKKKDEDQQAIE